MKYKNYHTYNEDDVNQLLSSIQSSDQIDGTLHTLFGLGNYDKSHDLIKKHIESDSIDLVIFAFRMISHLVRIHGHFDLDYFAPLIEREIIQPKYFDIDDQGSLIWDVWIYSNVKQFENSNSELAQNIIEILKLKTSKDFKKLSMEFKSKSCLSEALILTAIGNKLGANSVTFYLNSREIQKSIVLDNILSHYK